MNISKQVSAIKDCFTSNGYNDVEVTYFVSPTDSNIVTYYVTWIIGSNAMCNRKLELTVVKNRVIWYVTDFVGMPINNLDSLRKAIREAK